MKTKLQAQILFLLAACLFVLTVVHTSLMNALTAPLPKHEVADPLQLLQSPDAEQREKGCGLLEHSQEDTEDKIQATAEMFLKQSAQRRANNSNAPINQEGNPDDRMAADAIELLGELRSTRAIPFLVQHLTLFIFVAHIPSLGEAYPCAGALASIGSPSLGPLLNQVEQTDNPQTRRLTACVFVEALGRNVAADYIQDRGNKLKSRVAKRRLEQLQWTVRTDKTLF